MNMEFFLKLRQNYKLESGSGVFMQRMAVPLSFVINVNENPETSFID